MNPKTKLLRPAGQWGTANAAEATVSAPLPTVATLDGRIVPAKRRRPEPLALSENGELTPCGKCGEPTELRYQAKLSQGTTKRVRDCAGWKQTDAGPVWSEWQETITRQIVAKVWVCRACYGKAGTMALTPRPAGKPHVLTPQAVTVGQARRELAEATEAAKREADVSLLCTDLARRILGDTP